MKKILFSLTLLVFACSSNDNDNDNSIDCPSDLAVFGFYRDYPEQGDFLLEIVSYDLLVLAVECGYDCPELMEIDNQIENAREEIIVDESTYNYYYNQTGQGFHETLSYYAYPIICWEGEQ